MARANTSRSALLGVLARKPASGYDIRTFIAGSIAHFWSESYGQVYPLLKQLSATGLVAPSPLRRTGGRARQPYTLTPKGLRALRDWLTAPTKPVQPRSELLLKIFFGRHVPASVLAQHVERFRAHHAALLQTYSDLARDLPREHVRDAELPFWLMTVSFGHHLSRALVEWSDETLRALSRLARAPRPKPRTARRRSRAAGAAKPVR